ncbi:SusD/RagB family nutrient-binding outer membrane lipoprotein [Elizabethkingia anophelis]|uniref:SusD/RagB family nutrient-binding outer membrane lipoprotein n=1 Tax=Elizabethkingia anophelis TaxID=1117645 RepID=UPI0004E3DD4E|nr:SusD/RagB family nutrient-binding outer membrane lipoprotein [Elizabethkingia anophelis]KFC38356.1 hypothetical protein FF18_16515 [Elizabethkingia anophelis]MCT3697474.1 SusD/RagB family nutrient-binding outer membrane lipoprotein [Elizabethkingia anophelis]MCT3788789.1 SusD/RagB family nutrient-binding outer membrane lipoprotein [Elizabethkingia anophelis]MCT3896629.1 SusD/RagB family nutrient-binding outer membrane lipoprotein [Elizabethkingia anophelis]MCT4121280.1 SusD/RagB family nutr
MKKFKYIITVAGALLISSCQHELDTFNNNPNNPTNLTSPKTLLPGVEIGIINNSTGNLTRTLSLLIQQTNGVGFQSLDYTNYSITELDNEGDWANLYQSGMNAQQIITQFGDKNPYYGGIAKILLALNMGYTTDVWGDIPFSEAFRGKDNLTPKYDTQKDVISSIQEMLDSAISDLSRPVNANLTLPGSEDIFYGGDISRWIKLAYGIKARYAMRLTQRDGSSVAAQNTLTFLQKSLQSKDDNFVAKFDGGNNQNLWYAFNNTRNGYMTMGKFFIDFMKISNDPRLPFFAGLDANKGYSGSSPEDADDNASPFGSYLIGSASQPLNIFSYSEIKFLEAEALFRLGRMTESQDALRAAVSASLIDVTGADNPSYVVQATASVSLQNIITQKYIALFSTMEPYNDWRRTGFPVLVPNNNSQSKAIPVRLITPRSERTLNSNATVINSMYTPVWWHN